MASKKIFVPGEEVSVEEEFCSGKNTFEDNGIVKASGTGEAVFDKEKREVSISCKNVHNLEKDDVIYGRVVLVKESVAVIDIIKSEEKKVLTITRGQIPAKFASNAYVSNMKDYFKIGDYVRARVMSATDLAVDLSTKGEGFGVVTAYCSKCRKELKASGNKMICFSCSNTENRKWSESKDEYSERRNNFRGNSFNKNKNFGSGKKFDNKKNNFSFRKKSFRSGGR